MDLVAELEEDRTGETDELCQREGPQTAPERNSALLRRLPGIGALHGSLFPSTVDLELTKVIVGNFVKVLAWYDNEWNFPNPMVRTRHELVAKS